MRPFLFTQIPGFHPHGPCIRTACRIADPADIKISSLPLADPPALAVRIPVTEWRLPAFVMGFSPVFSRKSACLDRRPLPCPRRAHKRTGRRGTGRPKDSRPGFPPGSPFEFIAEAAGRCKPGAGTKKRSRDRKPFESKSRRVVQRMEDADPFPKTFRKKKTTRKKWSKGKDVLIPDFPGFPGEAPRWCRGRNIRGSSR